MVVREGFEPSKAEPADLQSAPFGRSGTSPHSFEWCRLSDSNQPPADYKSAALPIELRQHHYDKMYCNIRLTKCQELFKNFFKVFSFIAVSLSAISIYHESFFDASIFLNFLQFHFFLIGNHKYRYIIANIATIIL